MELIPAQKQKIWKWPAATNFSLGGLGAGFYLAALLVQVPAGGDWLSRLVLAAPLKLLGPGLVGLGLLALTTEAGRPLRSVNLLRHLRRSWMSREALAAAIFIPFAGLDWLLPHPALRGIAALAALAFIVCQGFIVYRARGVAAWNTPLMPLFFLTCGLSTGAGLLLVVAALYALILASPLVAAFSPAWLALIAGALNLFVWLLYTSTAEPGFRRATASLRHSAFVVPAIIVGQLLPVVLLALALAAGAMGVLLPLVAFVSGLALVFGGVRQKFALILEAGFLRPIELNIPGRLAPEKQSI